MIKPDVSEDNFIDFDERPTLPDLSKVADDYDSSPSYPGDYDAFDPEEVKAGQLEPEEE